MTGTDAFGYLREVRRTHNAAPVAAKGVKPTSYYELEKIEDRARVVAHLSEPIPRQYLDLADSGALGRYLDAVLREGLQEGIEYQVLSAMVPART